MVLVLKKTLLSNLTLKTISLILGFCLWYFMSQSYYTEITLSVPLCFDNLPNTYSINAPEHLNVTIGGKRADLYTLDLATLHAHINMHHARHGTHELSLTNRSLFLPPSIKLVHYTPSNLCVNVS